MLRSNGRVSSRVITRLHLLLAGCLCALFVCAPTVWCVPPTVVFNGVAVVLDTGSTALNHPKGVIVDNAGNVYIADTAHNQIVKVTPAGNAVALSITGLSTALSAPEGLALDGSGNLYIADTGNNRIVVVTTAGTGSAVDLGSVVLSSPGGVAIDASGNLFFADTGNNRIMKLPAGGSAAVLSITGLGTALSSPVGLAVDIPGNLYIADAGNNRIVKVTTGGAGSAVSISGLGTALSAPTGVAVDSFVNIFIADSGNNRVVKVTSGGAGSVLSTGSLMLNTPDAVAVNVSGQVYMADTANSRIAELMMSAVGFGELQVGASSGKSFTLPFTIGVATTLGSVQALLLGAQSLDFTLGAGTTCTNGTTNTTCNIEVQFLPVAAGLRRGGVALFDQSNTLLAVVPIYGTGGAPLAALSPGTASAVSTGGVSLSSPFGAAIDGAGNIYVGNYTGNNVVKIAAGGGSASVVSTGAYTLAEAAGVAVDGAGNLYIADYGHNRIVLVMVNGTASVVSVTGLGTAINQPAALALDGAGNLYIDDWGNNRIVKVTTTGAGSVLATGSYTLTSSGVTGVAVDPSGNVYIADRVANHIVKVAPSGAASLVSLTGLSLTNPQGVAVDGSGNLYIADSGHRRVVELTAAGIASVVQTPGQTVGSIVYGVTADANGNVFVVDWSNNRILKVDASASALSFASTKVGFTSSDSPKTATVTNLGNEALIFSANPTYTADFSENSSDTNLCTSSTSLAAGTSCDVSANFTPQSAASLSTNITVTHNNLNVAGSTQQIAVSGTGLTPGDTTAVAATVNPTTVNIGQSLTVTATVSDTTSGHESTIPTGNVSFTDTVGSIVVSLNSGNPVTLDGSGVATLSGATLSGAGSHTITANYAGVSGSFIASSNTAALTVTKTPVTVAGPGTQPVQVTVGQTGSVLITVTGPYSGLAVPSGSLIYSVLDASIASVASGSVTLTAGSTDSSATVPIASSLVAGNYTVSVRYDGDDNYAASTTATVVAVAVGLITPTVSLVSSANPVLVSIPVTFTVTVSSTAGAPSGTAAFYDGTTLLGSSTLASGTATYTTSALTVGTHSITAAYGGDTTFSALTSSAVSEVVADFTVSPTTSGGTSATVSPGGTASYSLLVSPTSGTTFPGAVTFAVTGLPTGAMATFTPPSLAAGAGATNVTLAVQVPTQTVSLNLSNGSLFALGVSPMMLGLLLPFGGRIRRTAGKRRKMMCLLLFVLAGTALIGIAGCGSSRRATSYTLTVTATSGTLSHSTTLRLTVR